MANGEPVEMDRAFIQEFMKLSNCLQDYCNGEYWGSVHEDHIEKSRRDRFASVNEEQLAKNLFQHDSKKIKLDWESFEDVAFQAYTEKYEISVFGRDNNVIWGDIGRALLKDYLRLTTSYRNAGFLPSGAPIQELPVSARRQALFSHIANYFPDKNNGEIFCLIAEQSEIQASGTVDYRPVHESDDRLHIINEAYLKTAGVERFSYWRWKKSNIDRHNKLRLWAFNYIGAKKGWGNVRDSLKPSRHWRGGGISNN